MKRALTVALALMALPLAAARDGNAAPTQTAPTAAACPWLALGTASHLLEVSAVAQVQSAEDGSGSCVFVPTELKPGKAASPQLRLTVSMAAQPPCKGHGKPLSGIGNQAEACENSHAHIFTVTGRVRERWFRLEGVNLPPESVRAVAPEWKNEPTLPTPLEVAAEQVASNLY